MTDTFTTHSSLFTPTLIAHRYPLSCTEIAHMLLTAFAKPSAETRYVVSMVLQSVHSYFEDDERPLIDDKHLEAVACLSDSLIALASRLEVDLKNQAWTGDVLVDVRKMYTRIVFKLTNFLLDTAGNDPRSVIIAVRATLEDTQHYLATSTTETIVRGIATTARKYHISYVRTATISKQECGMPAGPQGPMVYEGLLVRMRVGLRSALKKKLRGKKERAEDDDEEVWGGAEARVVCAESVVSGGDEASDSGVSMGEIGSEIEYQSEEVWVWGNGEIEVTL